MTLYTYPLFVFLAAMTYVIAIDKNVEDWITVKVKHFFVFLQTQRMKYRLLREIRAIERDKDRYLDIAKELLDERSITNSKGER